MINKRLINVALIATLGLGFSACGGGDSGGGSSNGGSTPSPLVSYTCEASSSYGGQAYTQKMGTSGNIVCNEQSYMDQSSIVASFADGINTMRVTQVIAENYFNTNSDNGTYTVNLKEGTEHIVGNSSEHGSVDCVNTYDTSLPRDFYDANEILYFDISSYQRVSTTCPDWVNDDSQDTETPSSFTNQLNLTITEESGAVTKISTLDTMK